MTVAELIERLEEVRGDTPVLVDVEGLDSRRPYRTVEVNDQSFNGSPTVLISYGEPVDPYKRDE